jgi:hypothetical protein
MSIAYRFTEQLSEQTARERAQAQQGQRSLQRSVDRARRLADALSAEQDFLRSQGFEFQQQEQRVVVRRGDYEIVCTSSEDRTEIVSESRKSAETNRISEPYPKKVAFNTPAAMSLVASAMLDRERFEQNQARANPQAAIKNEGEAAKERPLKAKRKINNAPNQ